MPSSLLIEIGCEEIPARMLPAIASAFAANLRVRLCDAGLVAADQAPTVAYTPRRLLFTLPCVLERQADREEQITGPPARLAVASDGSFTAQALAFAAKSGLSASDLFKLQTPKGEYVAVRKRTPGSDAESVIAVVLTSAFAAIELPRSMKWSATGGRFIRPVRWLLVMLGNKVVPCQLAGLTAHSFSYGHRTLSSGLFEISGAGAYPHAWSEQAVIADPAERASRIHDGINAALTGTGLRVRMDSALLDILVNLTEMPGVIAGGFDAAYLERLPEEVLVTVMRDHQKYFAVENANGKLAARFVAVMNVDADREGLIRHGNERVLRARFNDAQFFWDADRKLRLDERLVLLDAVTFHAKLGSYRDKSRRLRRLADALAHLWPGADAGQAAEAAELAKCDLTAELVKEFTELQGIMGGNYARAEGKSETLAAAIADQYLWERAPRSLEGAAVAIADKLDTIVGMFAIGENPTGSADPFGLRRQANGVVRILIEKQLPLRLNAACAEAYNGYGTIAGLRPQSEVARDLDLFFQDRLGFYLRDSAGFAYDTVAAVLGAGGNDPLDAERRAASLERARQANRDEFAAVAAALKRMRNIVKKEGGLPLWLSTPVDDGRMVEPAETELRQQVAAVGRAGDDGAQLLAISALNPVLTRFFDTVRVNAADPALRANRLALLAWAVRELSRIADFGEIVVPG